MDAAARQSQHPSPTRLHRLRFLLLRAAPGKYEPAPLWRGGEPIKRREPRATTHNGREPRMELKSTRRIVTGHDASGKAVALFDAALPAKQRSPGGNGMTLLWVTSESPVDMTSSADRAQTPV